jgi:hypothetical protein
MEKAIDTVYELIMEVENERNFLVLDDSGNWQTKSAKFLTDYPYKFLKGFISERRIKVVK